MAAPSNAHLMRSSWQKTVLAGLAGGIAANVAILATFRLIGFGWNGGGVLVDPAVQSGKLIAVWTSLEPLPLAVTSPVPIALGFAALAVVHAFIYRWLAASWPRGILARAWRIGLLLFVMSYVFFEFFTPYNMFGEPLPLVALELSFWVVVALAEGIALAAVMERGAN